MGCDRHIDWLQPRRDLAHALLHFGPRFAHALSRSCAHRHSTFKYLYRYVVLHRPSSFTLTSVHCPLLLRRRTAVAAVLLLAATKNDGAGSDSEWTQGENEHVRPATII